MCPGCDSQTVKYTPEAQAFGILWCSYYDVAIPMNFRCKECIAAKAEGGNHDGAENET
jgi:hypothetical protein